MVPFRGGMIPLNRFKYGSHSVLQPTARVSGVSESIQHMSSHQDKVQRSDCKSHCAQSDYLRGPAMTWGGFGNHVSTKRTMIAVL